jgi:hypothetical protein
MAAACGDAGLGRRQRAHRARVYDELASLSRVVVSGYSIVLSLLCHAQTAFRAVSSVWSNRSGSAQRNPTRTRLQWVVVNWLIYRIIRELLSLALSVIATALPPFLILEIMPLQRSTLRPLLFNGQLNNILVVYR